MTDQPTSQRICPQCGAPISEGGAPSVPCPACLMKLGLESWTGAKSESASKIAATPTQAAPGFEAPSPEELSDHFPDLEILELLGQGGMGAVYKARQTNLDRLVALKIIRPDVDRRPDFADRFRREAKMLAKLNHPHIVTVHDFGEVDGLFYLVMEYVDGINLRQSLAKGHLEPREVLAIIPSICDALQFAHEEGVVHRDIKPENILIDRKGRVKIADFGLAKLVGITDESKGLTQSRQVMGTWQYMAPEQMQGTKDVDHRADIYSLGVVLYEMLTGELPIGRFAPPSQKVQVDVRLDEIVLRTLESEPGRRYQRVSDVRTDLDSLSDGPMPAPAKQPTAGPAPSSAALNAVCNPGRALAAVGVMNWILMPIGVALFANHFRAEEELSSLKTDWVAFSWGAGILLVASMIFSTIMIAGGLKLQRLSSSAWPKWGAVLAMLMTPGNLIGLPVGIWVLVSVSSDEVRRHFARRCEEDMTPRYSRKAIVGAIWMCMFLLIPLLMLPAYTMMEAAPPEAPQSEPSVSPVVPKVLLTLLLLPPLTAIIGAPLLGISAIGDIRREPYRIKGLLLAFLDAIIIPLLFLNMLIVFAIATLGDALFDPQGSTAFSMLTSLIACGGVTIWLVRWGWRSATAGLNDPPSVSSAVSSPRRMS